MIIEVTQQDIDKARHPRGEVDYSTYCPIALAASRALHGRCVSVGAELIRVHLGKRQTTSVLTRGELPEAAKIFIENFDRYGAAEVKPFTFDVPTL